MLNKYIFFSLCFITNYTQGENEFNKIGKVYYNNFIKKIKSIVPNEAVLEFTIENYEKFMKNLFTINGKRNIILSRNYGSINPNISFNGFYEKNAVLQCIHNLHHQESNSVLNNLLDEMHSFAEKNIIKNYDNKLNIILSFGSDKDIINLFNEIEKNENIKEFYKFINPSSKLEYEKLKNINNDKLNLILRFLRIVENLTLKYNIENISSRYNFSYKNCFEMFYTKLVNQYLKNEDLINKDLVTEMMMYSYNISLQKVKRNDEFLDILKEIINANNLILHNSSYYLISLVTLVFIWNSYEDQLKNCKTKKYLPKFLGGVDPELIVDELDMVDSFSDSDFY